MALVVGIIFYCVSFLYSHFLKFLYCIVTLYISQLANLIQTSIIYVITVNFQYFQSNIHRFRFQSTI